MENPGCKNSSRVEVRKEFQLERIILFSDAVFAIVITLISIESLQHCLVSALE